VIALQRQGMVIDWSPSDEHQLTEQDKLFVLATRAGLGRLLARSSAKRSDDSPGAGTPGPSPSS
jgi:hypothetical protein